MYYMCIYTCTYKEREGGEGERETQPVHVHVFILGKGGREGGREGAIMIFIT